MIEERVIITTTHRMFTEEDAYRLVVKNRFRKRGKKISAFAVQSNKITNRAVNVLKRNHIEVRYLRRRENQEDLRDEKTTDCNDFTTIKKFKTARIPNIRFRRRNGTGCI